MYKVKLSLKALASLLLVVMVLAGFVQSPAVTAAAEAASPVWSFGVISDTQWTVADDGFNPNTSAINIIKQVNKQFINAGVKLVVAVGDMVDVGSATNIGTRALYVQDLYNAGIGFYPLRGNHESNDTGQAPIEVLKWAYYEAFSAYLPTNGPTNGPTNDQRGFS